MLARASSPDPLQGEDRSAIGILAGLVVLFLYAALFPVGTYIVTIGGVFVPIVILLSMRRVHLSSPPFFIALFLIGWPLLIIAGYSLVVTALTPEARRFVQSYGLWVVSVVLLASACLTRSPVQVRWILPVQIVLLVLMAVQFIGARFFSSMIGFEIVAPLFLGDLFDSYLGLSYESTVRAIGAYYEPSMCARVMGTLCFLDLMRSGRVARNFLFLGLTLLFTQSLGLVVMMALLGGVMLGRSWREFGLMVIGGSILAMVALPVIEQRGDLGEGSTNVRLVAPIETVEWAITNNAFGLPIGSMEQLAIRTGFVDQTGERKITNGVYEFLIYFGIFGVVMVFLSGIYTVMLIMSGEREFAAALIYLLISTSLSGSFLSIESSLLTYFFIVGAREARRMRFQRRAAELVGQSRHAWSAR